MIHEISKPAKDQYWIAYCNEADKLTVAEKHRQVHYGVTGSKHVTQSGMKNFKQFEDKEKWLAELKKSFNIDPEEDIKESSGPIEVAN